MYAPPGVDPDSSSGEEITPPSSPSNNIAPRFSFKSIFRPGKPRPPLLNVKPSGEEAQPPTSAEITPPGKKAKKTVRIFAEGDEPLPEMMPHLPPAPHQIAPPDHLKSTPLPFSGDTHHPAQAAPSDAGVGNQVLTMLQELIAETAAQREAQSQPQAQTPAVKDPNKQGPHTLNTHSHLNAAYYQGYPPPSPYRGTEETQLPRPSPAAAESGMPQSAWGSQAIQPHCPPPSNVPPYMTSPYQPPPHQYYPPWNPPPHLWGPVPYVPYYAPHYPPFAPPSAPPPANGSTWPHPTQPWPGYFPHAPSEAPLATPPHSAKAVNRAIDSPAPIKESSRSKINDTADTLDSLSANTEKRRKAEDVPVAPRERGSEKKVELAQIPAAVEPREDGKEKRKLKGGLNPNDVAEAVCRASAARETEKQEEDPRKERIGKEEEKKKGKEEEYEARKRAKLEEFKRAKLEAMKQGEASSPKQAGILSSVRDVEAVKDVKAKRKEKGPLENEVNVKTEDRERELHLSEESQADGKVVKKDVQRDPIEEKRAKLEKMKQEKLEMMKRERLKALEVQQKAKESIQSPAKLGACSSTLPPPSPRSPDELFKEEARRRYEIAKKEKLERAKASPSATAVSGSGGEDAVPTPEMIERARQTKKREELTRKMMEKAQMDRTARSGETSPRRTEDAEPTKQRSMSDKVETSHAVPAQLLSHPPRSLEQATIPSQSTSPAAFPPSADLSWSKALVSLAHCIDIVNRVLSSSMSNDHPFDHSKHSILAEILPPMLQALLSQQDMLSTMKEVLGPHHAPALDEFVRNLEVISAFLLQHKVGLRNQDPKHLEGLGKKSAEAFQSGSILILLQHLMQYSEHVSPTIFESIKSLMLAWQKDGWTIRNIIHTIMAIKEELHAIETSKERLRKGKLQGDGGGASRLLDQLIGLLSKGDHGHLREPAAAESHPPLITTSLPNSLQAHTREEAPKKLDEEHKHRDKLKVMMKSLGDKLHPSDIPTETEPDSPSHVTAPLTVQRKSASKPTAPRDAARAPQAIASSSRPVRAPPRRGSISSSSCYSDDSDDNASSVQEVRPQLVHANEVPRRRDVQAADKTRGHPKLNEEQLRKLKDMRLQSYLAKGAQRGGAI